MLSCVRAGVCVSVWTLLARAACSGRLSVSSPSGEFEQACTAGFPRSISHFPSCIKSVLTGVFFFPIKFNLKLNTQYVSCRSLNGKSQVRDGDSKAERNALRLNEM